MKVTDCIEARFSTRAFLDKPLPKALLSEILRLAGKAPSGVNSQPWHVHVLSKQQRDGLKQAIIAAREAEEAPRPDYGYYPSTWIEPYATRRKRCGLALYGALGIQKGDTEARKGQWYRNYESFGAPVALILTVDDHFGTGAFMDTGMFIQTLSLAAVEKGLGTCAQAAMAEYPDIVREQLRLPASELVVCGIAIGYPDDSHPINQYRTEREPLSEFVTWHDE